MGEKISAMAEVQAVSGTIFSALMMPEAGGFFIVLGYAPGEMAITKMNMVEGERLKSNRQVMLGKKMADALKKGVGDSINLGGSRFPRVRHLHFVDRLGRNGRGAHPAGRAKHGWKTAQGEYVFC